MRRSLAVILSTATLGTMVAATGCAEHRYQTNDPYYNSGYYGYNGLDAAEQARYREWLAERRYGYIEYNRLSAERQRGDHDRDDRDRRYARDRDDRDRRYVRDRDDRDRRYARDRDDRNRVYQNHSNNRDHDRKGNDRDHDHDHR